jgi:Ca-activated chloride channel family protein
MYLFFCNYSLLFSQRIQKQMPERTRILFVLDGSGSMKAEMNGQSRMDIAKEVLSDLIDSLKINPLVEIGLRVYGHQYDSKLKNCTDSKLEASFASGNHEQIKQKLKSIDPKGNTPISYSLEKSANDFPKEFGYRNVIILITDGIESCDGDPCAVSLALQKKSIFLRPFVIGLGVEEKLSKYFDCMGKFYNANSIHDFHKFLGEIMKQTMGKTTVAVELLGNGDKLETNVNMTFINSVSGKPEYDYVHYRDAKGKTDILEVDAVQTYDIIVNTTPQVIKNNVTFQGGKHNVVQIKCPQGNLKINQKGYMQFAKPLFAIVKKSADKNTLSTQQINKSEKYLVGKYDLEILILPRQYFYGVEISEGKTTEINLEEPGSLNIINQLKGYGSIYKLKEGEAPEWIYNFPDNQAQMTLALMPATYRMVFRVSEAVSSGYTIVKEFTIKSQEEVVVNLLK